MSRGSRISATSSCPMASELEVFRHARRRSRFHALDRAGRLRDQAAHTRAGRASKKPRIYRACDDDAARLLRRPDDDQDDLTTPPAPKEPSL